MVNKRVKSVICVSSGINLYHGLAVITLNNLPGGAQRNFDSYGHHLSAMSDEVQSMVCDPQTSGGLLIMVSKCAESEFHQIMPPGEQPLAR
jgi:selenide,water dikinase